MEKTLSNIGAVLLGSLVMIGMFAAVMYATSAEVWYAGEHTKGCDGSQDCGCYEKLLEMDRNKYDTITKSSKR
jgi:hypothetical protein